MEAVVEECVHGCPAVLSRVGPAHPRGREHATDGGDGVVMQPEELLLRAPPILDAELVPRLPVPRRHLVGTVAINAVPHPCLDELLPLGEILGRVGPALAVVESVGSLLLREVVAVGLGLHGERLGHEADLGVGPHAAGEVGVEDGVEDLPVVDGSPRGVFRIGVGRSPLERGRAVAGGEQVVGAEVDPPRTQFTQLAEKLLTVRHRRVVGLVGPKKPPHVGQRSEIARRVHADPHGERAGRECKRSLESRNRGRLLAAIVDPCGLRAGHDADGERAAHRGRGLVGRFDRERPRGVVPAEADAGTVRLQIRHALAVIVVEREVAVGAGVDAQLRRLGHLLCGELTHRIERDDRPRPGEERQRGEIDGTDDVAAACVRFACPPVVPGAAGQTDFSRGRSLFDDRCHEEITAPEKDIFALYRLGLVEMMQPERAHHRQPGVAGLSGQCVVVGEEPVAKVERLAAGWFDLGVVELGGSLPRARR